jgi:hypothetical protein
MNAEDRALKDRLLELDNAVDVDVTSAEADFLENVCFRQRKNLTEAQKVTAKKLLRKYGF